MANAPPSGGGAIPLQEYRKEVPPGWQPGDPNYPLRTYLDKVRLWYRITNMEDEAIGPLLAGRLYGRASKLALNLRVPRPHGGWDVGDAALIRLAVEEVRDPNDPNVVLQAYIPSGVQYLMNSLRQAFGMTCWTRIWQLSHWTGSLDFIVENCLSMSTRWNSILD